MVSIAKMINRNTILFLLMTMPLLSACGPNLDDDLSDKPAAGTINGTIEADAGSVVDSDVNDPNAPYRSNDSVAQAQAVTNPATIGGYANFSFDAVDYYSVTLAAGQAAVMYVGNVSSGDLDLYLYSVNDLTQPVDSAQGTGQIESVVAPTSGSFYLVVDAQFGSSNYVLSVGTSPAAANKDSLSMHADFVPGDIIVQYKTSNKNQSVNALTLQSVSTSLGLQAKAGAPNREMLLNVGDFVQREKAFNALGIKQNNSNFSKLLSAVDSTTQAKLDTIRVIKALRTRQDIKSVSPNYRYKPLGVPNDTFYSKQWHYPLINLPQAWDVAATITNPEVIVAVLDTGVVMNHPDLAGNLTASGYDFIRDSNRSLDGDGIDSNPDDPGDNPTPGLSSYHGTHVSGTVAARSNNGLGVAGVARNTKIMPLRVLGFNGGDGYDIIQAVRYSAGLDNDSNTLPPKRADVINLSLGSPSFSPAAQDAYTAARALGIIIVAAAGNASNSALEYPASYDGVVSVSAVNKRKQLAHYSSFGSAVDVAAPGGETREFREDGVLSTLVDDSNGGRNPVYAYYPGTSMAAPHMAGVVALMKLAYPGLTPDILDTILSNGDITEDLRNDGANTRNDQFGYGLIDALKAINKANTLNSGGTLPGIIKVNPNRLDFTNFSNNTETATITTSNVGTDPIVITSVTDNADWLTVNESSVDATTKLGDYTISVSRSGLPNAVHRAVITFTTDVGSSVNVDVSMQVGAPVVIGNVGQQYVLAIDVNTDSTVAETTAQYNNGTYSYSLTGVPAGSYIIVSGSDQDDDSFICGPAESCGGFPSLNRLSAIRVGDTPLNGIDFSSGFPVIVNNAIADDLQPSGSSYARKSTGLTTKQIDIPLR